MMQFTQILDLSHGRHVETILELTDFDLLYGNLSTSRELSSCGRDPAFMHHPPMQKEKLHTSIDDGICSLSDFLVFDPVGYVALGLPWKLRPGMTHHLFCRSALALSTASMRRADRYQAGI
jgi:hypothetical protein